MASNLDQIDSPETPVKKMNTHIQGEVNPLQAKQKAQFPQIKQEHQQRQLQGALQKMASRRQAKRSAKRS